MQCILTTKNTEILKKKKTVNFLNKGTEAKKGTFSCSSLHFGLKCIFSHLYTYLMPLCWFYHQQEISHLPCFTPGKGGTKTRDYVLR